MTPSATGEIAISGVHKRYGNDVVALSEVSLAIGQGEFVCLLGPSGCGKTTLLNCIAGFERPTSGRIFMDGKAVQGPGAERGVVFQEHGLLPWYTVAQNIGLGPRLRGVDAAQIDAAVTRYVELVGLQGFEQRLPAQLSGGMKQRVGIARALANHPEALLMDEPFGALDARTRQSMQEELLVIWEAERKTIVFVTHSIAEAVYLADRIVVMSPRPGRVETVVSVDIPRSRDRTSPAFSALQRELDDLLRSRS